MKIRIGNDIRLKLQLKFGEDSQKSVNIKHLKAIFINTTLKEKFEKEYIKKNRFVGRFPIEPFLNEFEPTAFAINSGGFPNYYAIVKDLYKGFGVYPNWHKSFPIKKENVTEYLAECQHTSEIDTVTTIFPAEAQLYPSVYKLVIVTKVYAPGYKNNLRTVTLDYCDLFELVCCSCEDGVDKPITMNLELGPESEETPVEPTKPEEPSTPDDPAEEDQKDVYVVRGTYSTNSIVLTRNDEENINIDIDSWYEEE